MLNSKLIKKISFYLYLFVLAYLSLFIGTQNAENNIIHKLSITDTGFVLHLVAYFIAAMLGTWVNYEKKLTIKLYVLSIIFIYSYALEILQYFHPYRSFNFYDVLANGLGIVIFILIYQIFGLRVNRNLKNLVQN